MNRVNMDTHAIINSYTKSLICVYPEKEHVQAKQKEIKKEPLVEKSVLYEDKDGRVVIKGVSNNEGKPIKR